MQRLGSSAVSVPAPSRTPCSHSPPTLRSSTVSRCRRRPTRQWSWSRSLPARSAKRARFTFRTQLRLDSVWFRDALRVGVALGIAIAVALVGDLPHAFWVALGTLSVLRGNALSTGYTVVQSLLGTLIGFALAAGLVSITADEWFLWMLLPLAAFLAAYTPSAIHFVVGQASFTVFVVVLFNLLTPQGWRTGLIRLGDIAIGAAVSLVVSVLFWPRGASAQLRRVWKLAIAANGRYVADAVEDRFSAPDEAGADEALAGTRRAAVAAERRASETFISFLGEQGRRRLPITTAQELLATSLLVNEIAGALEYMPMAPPTAGPCQTAADALIAEAGRAGGSVPARWSRGADQCPHRGLASAQRRGSGWLRRRLRR